MQTVLGLLASDWEGEIHLSARGLRNIRYELQQNDFEFVVGSSSYKCPCMIAEFLSPKISRLRAVDPTITQYVVKTKDPNTLFPSLIEMAKGGRCKATNESVAFYVSLINELESFDEITNLLNIVMDVRELNSDNAMEQMKLREKLTGTISEKELEYIAGHLYEISDAELLKLSYSVMDLILTRPDLKVASEDDLYDLICKFVAKDPEYIGLLQHVRFEFLSEKTITRFVENDSVIEAMNSSIWMAISRRLVLKPHISLKTTRGRYVRTPGTQFPVKHGMLDGIFAHLTKTSGGNPALNGTVSITSNNNHDTSEPITNLLALKERNLWHASHRIHNTHFQIDFMERRVVPTGYSIATNYGSCTGYNLKSWVVEVSDDDKEWTVVDTRKDDYALQENSTTGTFEIENQVECRYVRVRQVGNNHAGHTELYVQAFELYGELIE